MARKSVLDRLNDIEEHDPVQLGPAPTAVHLATVGVLTDLMQLAVSMSNGETPVHLRALLTMLNKSRPMLLEGLTSLPPEAIVEFMRGLRDRINVIVDTPLEAVTDEQPPGAAPAADAS